VRLEMPPPQNSKKVTFVLKKKSTGMSPTPWFKKNYITQICI